MFRLLLLTLALLAPALAQTNTTEYGGTDGVPCSCCVSTMVGTEMVYFSLDELTYDETAVAADVAAYTGKDTNANNYYINFCAPAYISPCFTGSPTAASCQATASNTNPFNIGEFTTVQASFGVLGTSLATATLAIHYDNGAQCSSSKQWPRATDITMACDPSGTIPIQIGQVSENTQKACDYLMTVTSQYACASGDGFPGGSSGFPAGIVGWTIMFVLSLLFFVYVIIGIAFQFKFREARGIELVPNYEFWKDIPFLIKDGIVFLIQKISCGRLCSGYSSI